LKYSKIRIKVVIMLDMGAHTSKHSALEAEAGGS
jgi:hypothetical protein